MFEFAVAPGDAFDAEDALFAGDMGKPWRADDIADGVDTGEIGFVVDVGGVAEVVGRVVGFDMAFDGFQAE